MVARVAGDLLEGGDVFGEAAAAVADTGLEEVRPDPFVEPHPVRHDGHVRAGYLADVGDLVDEADLGGEKRIGCVLDHLRRGDVGGQHGRVDTPIQGGYTLGYPRLVGPHHHAVRVHEVVDGRALPEELRVGGIVDVSESALRQFDPHRRAGAHRNGGLGDQDALGVVQRQPVEGPPDAGQVGVARIGGGSVHAQEDELRPGVRNVQVCGEIDPLPGACDELRQAGFVDGDPSGLKQFHLGLVDVQGYHLVAKMGHARGRHQADVPCSHHRQATHDAPLSGSLIIPPSRTRRFRSPDPARSYPDTFHSRATCPRPRWS